MAAGCQHLAAAGAFPAGAAADPVHDQKAGLRLHPAGHLPLELGCRALFHREGRLLPGEEAADGDAGAVPKQMFVNDGLGLLLNAVQADVGGYAGKSLPVQDLLDFLGRDGADGGELDALVAHRPDFPAGLGEILGGLGEIPDGVQLCGEFFHGGCLREPRGESRGGP